MGNTNLKEFENTGVISGEKREGISIFAGNGTAVLENFNNKGIIFGKDAIKLQSNAKSLEKSIINNLINTGVISSDGNGIWIFGNNPSISKLVNSGVISSQNTALMLQQGFQTQEQGQANIYNYEYSHECVYGL